jgi:hypothetical protein
MIFLAFGRQANQNQSKKDRKKKARKYVQIMEREWKRIKGNRIRRWKTPHSMPTRSLIYRRGIPVS